MNLLQLISLLLPSYNPVQQPVDDTIEVLEDYPECGQLGDASNKECFWGCDWEPSPLEGLDDRHILGLIHYKVLLLGMCQDVCQC